MARIEKHIEKTDSITLSETKQAATNATKPSQTAKTCNFKRLKYVNYNLFACTALGKSGKKG